MTTTEHKRGIRPLRLGALSVASLAAFSAALLVTMAGTAQAAATAVPLGTAGSFVVLAGAGITNTGPTTLNGDLGTFPTTSITGAGSMTVTGTNHGGDAVTQGAKTALVTAYNDAAGQGPRSPIAADLAGLTLAPGVYNSASSVGLSGALTLDAAGDPRAVFVFQAGSSLTTASGSQVLLVNGAQACNVFWQVGSSATLGTASVFRGSILALTDITVTTGATLEGRVLARNGAVTLDTNTITRPQCAAGTGSAPSATATPSVTATTSGGSGSGSGGGGDTPDSSETTQVTEVPDGGVDTGSGSGGLGVLGTGVVALAVIGGGTAVALRRRHQSV
jgi:type VI secretion system secreted protein VgrG